MGIFSRFLPPRSARFLGLFSLLLAFACWYPPRTAAQWNPLNPVQSLQRNGDGATLFLERGALRFQVCNGSMVRVLYSPARKFPTVSEYVVIKTDWAKTNFDVSA